MASFALEHLTFTYPGQTRPALSDLTLTIPEGRSEEHTLNSSHIEESRMPSSA